MGRTSWRAVVLVVCLGGGVAVAQEEDDNDGLELRAHGGISGLTGNLGAITAPGPIFGVEADASPFESLRFEVGYDGARYPLVDERVGKAGVWRHAATGLVKLVAPTGRFEPFVGAGAGVSLWDPSSGAEELYNTDVAIELPVAAGLELEAGSFDAGVRVTYRGLVSAGFADPAVEGDISGNVLSATATFGGSF